MMRLFKKKLQDNKKTHNVKENNKVETLSVENLPTEALNLTYEELMNKYSKTNDEKTQKQLKAISIILRERARKRGNGKAKNFAITHNLFSENEWDALPEDEKQKLSQFMGEIGKAEKLLEAMTRPEQENNDYEIEIPTEVKIKQEETNEDSNVFLQEEKDKPVTVVQNNSAQEEKDKPVTVVQNNSTQEEKPKEKSKKSFSSFFKKKAPQKYFQEENQIEKPESSTSIKNSSVVQTEETKSQTESISDKKIAPSFGKKKPKVECDPKEIENNPSDQNQSFKTLVKSGLSNVFKKGVNIESELAIIRRLNEEEIGDSNRINSIRNYLLAGQLLIPDDFSYLKELYEQLKIKEEDENVFESKTKHRYRVRSSKPQTILIDKVEENPTHEFTSLSRTITNIIKDSVPHFTVGIYGEWGTGKTTLMQAIENNLHEQGIFEKQQKIVPVWFNAWKHDREDNIATLSLMKTVAYALENHEKFYSVSKTIFSALTIYDKEIMEQFVLKLNSQDQNELEEQIEEKMAYLHKLYRNSVYFDGTEKIKRQMQSIRKSENGNEHRIVIFIDDLDRCSPEKALEVLESIKLFLDIEGFVFVIGLSHKTVTKLISHVYQSTGVKGEDYIKKIIQIPIQIPTWSHESIVDLIETRIAPVLNQEYTNFLHQNSAMVAKVVEYNPRQLKRFINNVIIAFETFANKENSPEITFNEIFLVKLLNSKWPDFYVEFVRNEDFRETVRWMISRPRELKKYFKYLKEPTDEEPIEQKNRRISLLHKLIDRTQGRINSQHIDILADFDMETWIFFENVQDVLNGIEDWKVINNVMDVVEELPYNLPIGSKKPKPQEQKPEN